MADTLILVPGLNCTRRLFEPQIEALSRSRTVLVADTTRDESIAGMARRLLIDAPERFAIAGLSMGGYVAMEVLRQAPGRVAALGLLDTSARPETDDARADRERLIALAEGGRFEEVHSILWPRLVSEARASDDAPEATVRAMMREIGPETFVRQERAIMARVDSRPDLPGIEIPTLVLVGAEDRLTPPEVAREMADMIEWASLVVVPAAGH